MNGNTSELTQKRCVPCEGGVPVLKSSEVQKFLKEVPGWKVTEDGKRIHREWQVKDFVHGLELFRKVGQIAEEEGHHPDLHLVGYRNVIIEIWTHAIGGLSENDFILAAKINQLMADPDLREKFGKAGRKRAEEKFRWSAIAEETKQLYETLTTRPRS
jgi:4a-hydroxytetrahydrobiopterin dehydratase